ncbi:MAG TPA: hypothetical protein VNM40_01910 [Candidatus Paceibacterota bacterium]|nr:hypothetical protein [Candidatus Paceibacterota bacterium]
MVLSGIVLANNTRFGNVIVLQNLAHDIALSIRQAQVYGIAVRRCDPTVTELCPAINQFDVAYGVHFMGGEPTFELFVDVDNSGDYDPGETVLSSTIATGYRIDDLCVTPAVGGAETCGLEELNVVFRRPEPDACINGSFDSDDDCVSSYARARIIIKSARDDEAEVIVERTGQISAL